MQHKQKMRDSDRSHPHVQQLDALLQSGLTFQCEADVEEAERCHMNIKIRLPFKND